MFADFDIQGIYEGGQNYDKADLKLWIKNFAPYVKGRTSSACVPRS